MMKALKTILTITIILIETTFTFGQKLSGLAFNHAIMNAVENGDKNFQKGVTEIIDFDTDFFDDFSDYYYSVFPRNNHWSDRYAYINSTYPDSMISMGVATLDAFDPKGYPYYSADQKIVPADTLTSQPFRFLHKPEGKVFFSFFYEPGGKGDPPEGINNDIPESQGRDTLLVEFYNASDAAWHKVYYTLDNTDIHSFKQAIIEVDTFYLKDGFRFRFRNYVSLPANYQQGQDLGMFSNADLWHIDYIEMKEAENSSEMATIKDVAIVKPLLPTLTEYTTVPWKHLTLAQTASESGIMPLTIRNFDANNGSNFNVDRIFWTFNLTSGEKLRDRSFKNLIEPYQQITFRDSIRSGISYTDNDTVSIGRFEIVAHIEPDIGVEQRFVNDTVKRTEIYFDQYAYDDGSAELGFGISGENQENSRIAQRYRIFRRSNNPDTLKAVLIYFCKSMDAATESYSYSVSIRKNNGDMPAGENLYTSDTLNPDYSLHLNEFTRIELDPPLAISDTFFIVINQLTGYLNIGYDVNNENLDKIFVYTNQTWQNPTSIINGSLMIRPSFGNYSLPTRIESHEVKIQDIILYPNPVSDYLYFNAPWDQTENMHIEIFNALGILQIQFSSVNSCVQVSSLKSGIYFIVFTSADGLTRYTKKFIKE